MVRINLSEPIDTYILPDNIYIEIAAIGIITFTIKKERKYIISKKNNSYKILKKVLKKLKNK